MEIEAEEDTKQPAEKVPKHSLRKRVSLWKKASQSAFGALLCILTALGYATNSFLAKLLMTTDTSPHFVAFSRQVGIVLSILPVVAYSKTKLISSEPLKKHWRAVTLRCLFGSLGLTFYIALYLAPLADVGVLFTSALPVFSCFLSRIFFHERIRHTDLMFMAVAAIGVALILRPPFLFPPEIAHADDGEDRSGIHRIVGGGFALLASFFVSVAIMGVRWCNGEVHYSAIVFWNSVVGLVVSFVIMVSFDGFSSPCPVSSRILVIIAAFSGMIAQASTTLSIRYISPVIVSLSTSIEVAFLFFFQITFLGRFPHLFSVIGSSIILFAMILLVLRSWVIDKMRQKEDKPHSSSVFSQSSKHYPKLKLLSK